MVSLGTTITIYTRDQPPRTFYGKNDYYRFQVQEAEELWNRWTSSQRLNWWLFALCCGSRQPIYGVYPSLIGKPGLVPGTRILFEHRFE
jgi:hypothetical protein